MSQPISHSCESHDSYHEYDMEHGGMPFQNIDFIFRIMQKALEDIKTCTGCCCEINRSNLVMNSSFEFSCNKCMVDDGTCDIISADHLLTVCRKFYSRREGLSECPVCMDTLNDENTWSTPCGHMFCESCIYKLETCAVCRSSLIDNY